jgi:hypothetical protein
MKQILERLFSIKGIRAAAVYDPKGSLLAAHGDDLAPKLEGMGGTFATLLSPSTSSFAANVSSGIFHFEGGTLVLRRNADVLLAIVGDKTFDVSEHGAAVPLNVALVALKMGARRGPRQSGTVPAGGPQAAPIPIGAPKAPKL